MHPLTEFKIRDGLDLVLPKLAKVIKNLQEFALKYKDLPTLGFVNSLVPSRFQL